MNIKFFPVFIFVFSRFLLVFSSHLGACSSTVGSERSQFFDYACINRLVFTASFRSTASSSTVSYSRNPVVLSTYKVFKPNTLPFTKPKTVSFDLFDMDNVCNYVTTNVSGCQFTACSDVVYSFVKTPVYSLCVVTLKYSLSEKRAGNLFYYSGFKNFTLTVPIKTIFSPKGFSTGLRFIRSSYDVYTFNSTFLPYYKYFRFLTEFFITEDSFYVSCVSSLSRVHFDINLGGVSDCIFAVKYGTLSVCAASYSEPCGLFPQVKFSDSFSLRFITVNEPTLHIEPLAKPVWVMTQTPISVKNYFPNDLLLHNETFNRFFDFYKNKAVSKNFFDAFNSFLASPQFASNPFLRSLINAFSKFDLSKGLEVSFTSRQFSQIFDSFKNSICPDVNLFPQNFSFTCPTLSCPDCPTLNFSCPTIVCPDFPSHISLDKNETMEILELAIHNFFFLMTGDKNFFVPPNLVINNSTFNYTASSNRVRRSILTWLLGGVETIMEPFFKVFVKFIGEIVNELLKIFLDIFIPTLEQLVEVFISSFDKISKILIKILSLCFKLLVSVLQSFDSDFHFLEFFLLYILFYYFTNNHFLSFVFLLPIIFFIGSFRFYPSLVPILAGYANTFREISYHTFNSTLIPTNNNSYILNFNGKNFSIHNYTFKNFFCDAVPSFKTFLVKNNFSDSFEYIFSYC